MRHTCGPRFGAHAYRRLLSIAARGSEGKTGHLVKHLPDGRARLVDGGDDGVAQAGQVAHVLHHIQRGEAVQPCIGMPLSTLLLRW